MKKWLLPVAGAVALSSCALTFVFGLSNDINIRTQYRDAATNGFVGCDIVKDQDGNTLSKVTTVRVDFQANARVQNGEIRLVGVTSDAYDDNFVETFSQSDLEMSSNNIYTARFQADTSNNKFLPQAINVVPKPKIAKVSVSAAKNIGSFRARVTATSADGARDTETSLQAVKVYQSCTLVSTTTEDL